MGASRGAHPTVRLDSFLKSTDPSYQHAEAGLESWKTAVGMLFLEARLEAIASSRLEAICSGMGNGNSQLDTFVTVCVCHLTLMAAQAPTQGDRFIRKMVTTSEEDDPKAQNTSFMECVILCWKSRCETWALDMTWGSTTMASSCETHWNVLVLRRGTWG